MACDLSFSFEGSADDLVKKIKEGIESRGGTFSGNSTLGTFSISSPVGRIEGSYTIGGQVLSVHISKKPLPVSCDKIEEVIGNFIR